MPQKAKTGSRSSYLPVSLDPKKIVPLQSDADLGGDNNASSGSLHPDSRTVSSSRDLEGPKSLSNLTEGTDLGYGDCFNVECLSTLQLWVYQNSKDVMTVAERLERLKWEHPRLERL